MMGEIIRYFDGILAPIGCVSVTAYERCTQEPVCRFRRIFLKIRNDAAEIMDHTSLAAAAKNLPVSAAELASEFSDGGGI
jgi:DNA-binding IscR family transcriptional regulator